jgi:hypothetical protein
MIDVVGVISHNDNHRDFRLANKGMKFLIKTTRRYCRCSQTRITQCESVGEVLLGDYKHATNKMES